MKITIPDDLAERINRRAWNDRRRARNEALWLIEQALFIVEGVEDARRKANEEVLQELSQGSLLPGKPEQTSKCKMIPFALEIKGASK